MRRSRTWKSNYGKTEEIVLKNIFVLTNFISEEEKGRVGNSINFSNSNLTNPNPNRKYGVIRGVKPNSCFKNRKKLCDQTIHLQSQAGIDGASGKFPAPSVVANSREECDGDFGSIFYYFGQGIGRQEMSRYNKALGRNYKERIPVRLIRGEKIGSKYSPMNGYIYSGLYWVVNIFRYNEKIVFKMYRGDNQGEMRIFDEKRKRKRKIKELYQPIFKRSRKKRKIDNSQNGNFCGNEIVFNDVDYSGDDRKYDMKNEYVNNVDRERIEYEKRKRKVEKFNDARERMYDSMDVFSINEIRQMMIGSLHVQDWINDVHESIGEEDNGNNVKEEIVLDKFPAVGKCCFNEEKEITVKSIEMDDELTLF